MASVRVVVGSSVGLHARPAAVFVRAVAASGLLVTIARISDGAELASSSPVDARSILALLALDVGRGEEVELVADGPDAAAVLESLAVLLAAE
jgi:phosphocarrier protein